MISDKRLSRFKTVISNRQELTVILENVHDKHNIGAVMRSCDSVGIQELFVVYTDNRLSEEKFLIGKNSASSAAKWLTVHFFEDLDQCISEVRSRYKNIYATHLGKEAKSIHEVKFDGSVALMFGNEKEGLSKSALEHADQNILIPQYGMIKSLNISVACAVTLYEASRQRFDLGLYHRTFEESNPAQKKLLKYFMERNELDNHEY